jgi:hypothetical protein
VIQMGRSKIQANTSLPTLTSSQHMRTKANTSSTSEYVASHVVEFSRRENKQIRRLQANTSLPTLMSSQEVRTADE